MFIARWIGTSVRVSTELVASSGMTMLGSARNGKYSVSQWIGQGYQFATQAQDVNSDEVSVRVQRAPAFVAVSGSKDLLGMAIVGNPRGTGQTVIIQRW